jgi:HK97 family phage major capsid protein
MPNHLKLPPQWRAVEITRANSDENREGGAEDSYEISFSSEEPYERWWGIEILGHKKEEVDMSWMASGRAPLLVDHEARVDSMVGVVDKAWIEGGRAKALVRFGKGARAQDIKARVDSGELSSISVGYRIEEMQLVKSQKDGPSTYRATKWKPHEASLVAIPADPTVGVGRSDDAQAAAVRILNPEPNNTTLKGHSIMDPELKAALEAAEARGVKGAWVTPGETVKPVAKTPEQILSDDRKRMEEIEKIGKRFNKGALASEHAYKGTSIAEFQGLVLAAVGDGDFNEKNMNANSLGLSKKEAKAFRFTRLIAGLMDPTANGRALQEAAAFEMEVVRTHTEKLGRSNTEKRGLAVPIDVLRTPLIDGQRDLTAGVAGAGGNTVATDLMTQDFITLLRNRMMVQKMGARMLMGLEGNVAIPRQTGGATGYWVAENANLTESQQAFDQVPMTPKTYGAFTDWSRRLMLQSSLDVEAFVRLDLATVLALGVDYAALHGTGAASQPLGLAGQTGVNVVALGANGAAPVWANIVQMETEVATDNADIGTLGYLTNAKVRGKLKTTEKAATTGLFLMPEQLDAGGFNQLNGYRAGVTNQVRSDMVKGASGAVCSGIFYGNWADLVIGQWSGLDMLIDPYTGAIAGTVRAVAMMDVDVAVRHGESFSYVADALTV